ncbi:DNA-binding protein [Leptolyngbya sp. FACHB-261]|uniref:DNA-binding protein n=1 Tax=Leptolyngbya sp. FACHB-261 TaxID=2692806 RepID=UPI00168596DB|nr:DNA-binding protein [Leptolyngbya sp. FACHB-261]MBD2101911.1 DNA-binding protein [Leptolyngbya sp. FACHB-261]
MTAQLAHSQRGKVRLSLDVSPELNDVLEELAARSNGTKSDVLRKAITLMKVATDARDKGLKVGIVDENQHLVTEIVGI